MRHKILVIAMLLVSAAPAFAQATRPVQAADYVVGAQDVLLITSYDQPDLTGKFAVESDGTFTFPLIGRVTAGGVTLREVEAMLEKQLVDGGFFTDPQVTVAMDQYRSQRVFVVGEVRTPGAYPMSGEMRLVEALARAGSMLPTASGEAVVVHPSTLHGGGAADAGGEGAEGLVRIDLRDLANGVSSQNVALSDGDTIFVLRAENVYVFGQVKSPGAYPLRQKNTTVLQALALAGGVTDRGSIGRIQIVRIVNGEKQEIKADLTDDILPLDTIIVPERFF